jgi:hypothetical protein
MNDTEPTRTILGAAIEVHKRLAPGALQHREFSEEAEKRIQSRDA